MSMPVPDTFGKLQQTTSDAWLDTGNFASTLGDLDRAIQCYDNALKLNPYSIPAISAMANAYRARENFGKAIEYYQAVLALAQNGPPEAAAQEIGSICGSLGHCYLMLDDLQKAYEFYQQALYHMRNPKDPKLWYGIGILYDRYGSLEYAEEAFSQVLEMDPGFEKANEIYFRLGIIYKQQHKFGQSLDCFRYILRNPPKPLTAADIYFQIGHVHEQTHDYQAAKEAYERVLQDNPTHAKVLQQLGWLNAAGAAVEPHEAMSDKRNGTTNGANSGNVAIKDKKDQPNLDLAVRYLSRAIDSDSSDPQSWYLLGRCYMAQQQYNKAYEAYQQAVYRDGRNATFWCSIGVLYYQINQYRDALDAYSRAIKLNPYISEVWYDLGTLYESCNNQTNDALDAYQRAAELDPNNQHIRTRLEQLRQLQAQGGIVSTQGTGNGSEEKPIVHAQPIQPAIAAPTQNPASALQGQQVPPPPGPAAAPPLSHAQQAAPAAQPVPPPSQQPVPPLQQQQQPLLQRQQQQGLPGQQAAPSLTGPGGSAMLQQPMQQPAQLNAPDVLKRPEHNVLGTPGPIPAPPSSSATGPVSAGGPGPQIMPPPPAQGIPGPVRALNQLGMPGDQRATVPSPGIAPLTNNAEPVKTTIAPIKDQPIDKEEGQRLAPINQQPPLKRPNDFENPATKRPATDSPGPVSVGSPLTTATASSTPVPSAAAPAGAGAPTTQAVLNEAQATSTPAAIHSPLIPSVVPTPAVPTPASTASTPAPATVPAPPSAVAMPPTAPSQASVPAAVTAPASPGEQAPKIEEPSVEKPQRQIEEDSDYDEETTTSSGNKESKEVKPSSPAAT